MPEPPDAIDLGHALRSLRRRADLSQRELAALADAPKSAVSRIESGQPCDPRFRTVERLVRAAGGVLGIRLPDAGLPAHPHEDLRDRGGRHYPAHLDPRKVTSPEQWWGAWWALTMVRSHWPLEEVPPYTYDLSRSRRDEHRSHSPPRSSASSALRIRHAARSRGPIGFEIVRSSANGTPAPARGARDAVPLHRLGHGVAVARGKRARRLGRAGDGADGEHVADQSGRQRRPRSAGSSPASAGTMRRAQAELIEGRNPSGDSAPRSAAMLRVPSTVAPTRRGPGTRRRRRPRPPHGTADRPPRPAPAAGRCRRPRRRHPPRPAATATGPAAPPSPARTAFGLGLDRGHHQQRSRSALRPAPATAGTAVADIGGVVRVGRR